MNKTKTYRVDLTDEDIELIKKALEDNSSGRNPFMLASSAHDLASNQRVKQITDKLEDAKKTQVRA